MVHRDAQAPQASLLDPSSPLSALCTTTIVFVTLVTIVYV